MSEPFLGEIRMFCGNFSPRGWALCDGQLLPIAQNSALFSLLGTTYGGNGQTTFALPDLRGRAPIHAGQGPGLSPYNLGQNGGAENVTISASQMPPHQHAVTPNCGNSVPQSPLNDPTNSFPTGTDPGTQGLGIYTSSANAVMGSTPTSIAGGGQPVANIQPYLCVNFIIATEGIYPSRN